MSDTLTGSSSTTCMLQDECIAFCRGVADLPTSSTWGIQEKERTRTLESNSEWIINYRSLVARFERRRKRSQSRASPIVSLLPSAELHAICADRIAAIISYLEKLEPRNVERCWSESRPYLSLSSRQDREMGRSAKHYLFTDAQKIWTLDALLSEEEAENLLRQEDEQEETVLTQWKKTIMRMGTRCSEELLSSLASSALFNELLTRGSDTGAPRHDTSRLRSTAINLPAYGTWCYSVKCTSDGQVDLNDTLRQIQSVEDTIINRYMETHHIWEISQSGGQADR